MHRWRGLFAVLALLALAAVPARAQDSVALFADSIRYASGSGELIAEGNVEVYYQGSHLSAAAIRYDGNAGTIHAEGPIQIEGPDGAVVIASLAELSADFREGLIAGARVVFNRRFQIATAEGRRTEGRFSTLYRTVATSCSICDSSDVPIWRIRARKVIHDEAERLLYFEGAWLDIFGLPVFYLPRMRTPEPGVERAEGFLPPSLRTSDKIGIGVKLPYYMPLGDHADVTLTPFLTTGGATILEGEYRRMFRNGSLQLDGALAVQKKTLEGTFRGYGQAVGKFDLPAGFVTDFDLSYASDRSFMRQFDYSKEDRLESHLSVRRARPEDFVEFRAEAYRSLRGDIDQGGFPLVLPSVRWQNVRRDVMGGRLGLEATLLGLSRDDGRDVLRAGIDADWRAERFLPGGVQVAAIASFGGDIYAVGDDAVYGEEILARAVPTLGVELRWPLMRATGKAVHVIEPIAQLLYSARLGDDDVPNEDSVLPEFDENNLFSDNRFPGRDRHETGLRVNAGIGYTRYDPAGWNLGVTVGRVYSSEPTSDFPAYTSLEEELSDYVAAVSLELPPRFNGVARGLFDDRLVFKRADVELDYTTRRLDANAVYTFLAEDANSPVLGLVPESEELTLGSRYRFLPNWEIEAEWRYDLAAERSVEATGGLAFGNECIEARLEVTRTFPDTAGGSGDTELAFEVSLGGFGRPTSGGWPASQCRGKS